MIAARYDHVYIQGGVTRRWLFNGLPIRSEETALVIVFVILVVIHIGQVDNSSGGRSAPDPPKKLKTELLSHTSRQQQLDLLPAELLGHPLCVI